MPTVGESVSCNAAGPDGRPAITHVESITLVTPGGELRRVEPHREPRAVRAGRRRPGTVRRALQRDAGHRIADAHRQRGARPRRRHPASARRVVAAAAAAAPEDAGCLPGRCARALRRMAHAARRRRRAPHPRGQGQLPALGATRVRRGHAASRRSRRCSASRCAPPSCGASCSTRRSRAAAAFPCGAPSTRRARRSRPAIRSCAASSRRNGASIRRRSSPMRGTGITGNLFARRACEVRFAS